MRQTRDNISDRTLFECEVTNERKEPLSLLASDQQNVCATVKREREVRAFAELSHANLVLLENARHSRPGYFYECMTAILMSAFRFEAYLNHVGEAILPFWGDIERLPWRSKLNIVRTKLGLSAVHGKRPYQTLFALFRFRDALAHGRNERLDPPEATEVGSLEDLRRRRPLTGWEQLCTIDFAEQSFADTQTIIEEIHKSASLPEFELSRAGHSYCIRDVQHITSP
jgi:hypothetical protein